MCARLGPQSPHKARLCVSSHPERSPTPWAAPSPALRGQGGHGDRRTAFPAPHTVTSVWGYVGLGQSRGAADSAPRGRP